MTKSRLKNVAMSASSAVQALQAFTAAVDDFGLPRATVDLVHLRASQINGCSVCTDLHSREAKNHGEKDERLYTLAAWHETPYFTDAERAALALTEAATRISDRSDAVSDEVWDEAGQTLR
jgi:AhpD family alkylhydroperoxidase